MVLVRSLHYYDEPFAHRDQVCKQGLSLSPWQDRRVTVVVFVGSDAHLSRFRPVSREEDRATPIARLFEAWSTHGLRDHRRLIAGEEIIRGVDARRTLLEAPTTSLLAIATFYRSPVHRTIPPPGKQSIRDSRRPREIFYLTKSGNRDALKISLFTEVRKTCFTTEFGAR